MVYYQSWDCSEHSHITWYANLYHSTSDSAYVSSVCKSFSMQWVLQFNGQITVTRSVVGRTLRVKKHFRPPTPNPRNPICLANSFIGQCQSSTMHCSVMPMDKNYPCDACQQLTLFCFWTHPTTLQLFSTGEQNKTTPYIPLHGTHMHLYWGKLPDSCTNSIPLYQLPFPNKVANTMMSAREMHVHSNRYTPSDSSITSTCNILPNMCTRFPTLTDFWPKKYPWCTEQHQ